MSDEKKVKCHLCGKTFDSVEERDMHNKEVHPTAYRLSHLVHGIQKNESKQD